MKKWTEDSFNFSMQESYTHCPQNGLQKKTPQLEVTPTYVPNIIPERSFFPEESKEPWHFLGSILAFPSSLSHRSHQLGAGFLSTFVEHLLGLLKTMLLPPLLVFPSQETTYWWAWHPYQHVPVTSPRRVEHSAEDFTCRAMLWDDSGKKSLLYSLQVAALECLSVLLLPCIPSLSLFLWRSLQT